MCVPFIITPPLSISRNSGDWVTDAVTEDDMRIDVLDVNGKPLLIILEVADGGVTEPVSQFADDILSTLTFD